MPKYEILGPEVFFYGESADNHGYIPERLLDRTNGKSLKNAVTDALGFSPNFISQHTGYGIFLEHEDTWIFGYTRADALIVSEEWPIEEGQMLAAA